MLWLTTLVLVLAQIPAGTALPGGALFDNYLILLFLASNGARSVIATLAVASQANVGGAASAIAIAGARGYSDRLVPGVAVDLLGYALGNHLGLAVGLLMRGVLGA